MKATPRHARMWAGLAATLVAAAAPSALEAQRRNAPPPDAPRMMITTLRSSEKGLGVQAADAIRSRINQDFPYRELWVIPKNDINSHLEASGYPTTEPLAVTDLKALATLMRADEWLDATVRKGGAGYQIEGKLVLSRDPALVQPLPMVEGPRMDVAAMLLSRELEAARRQLPAEKKCMALAREQKYQEALAAADEGIAAYPKGTLARICKANVLVAMDAAPDSVIAVAQQVLELDPRSRIPLALAAQAYKEASVAAAQAGDTARASQMEQRSIETLLELLGTDPKNVRLATQVVNELAASGNARVAIPIIERIVAENPGDPDLLRLQYLIFLTVRDWKKAIAAGESLIQTDTAATDTLFFIRLAGAYAGDSQPQKAAEAVARGIAKFPQNATLQVTYAQMLKNAGQLPQAMEALRKALAADPKVDRGYLLLAQMQMDMQQPDSAFASLRNAMTVGGGDSTFVGQFALSLGNQLYKAAGQTKQRADYDRAIAVLTFADSTLPAVQEQMKQQAQFLIGASSLVAGQTALQEANQAKSCDLARAAQAYLTQAQINLPKGGRFAPDATAQFMGYLQQLSPVADQQIKAFCR